MKEAAPIKVPKRAVMQEIQTRKLIRAAIETAQYEKEYGVLGGYNEIPVSSVLTVCFERYFYRFDGRRWKFNKPSSTVRLLSPQSALFTEFAEALEAVIEDSFAAFERRKVEPCRIWTKGFQAKLVSCEAA